MVARILNTCNVLNAIFLKATSPTICQIQKASIETGLVKKVVVAHKRHTTETGAFCNCYKADCGDFCLCACHKEKPAYHLDGKQLASWDFVLDRVNQKLPIYMDDVSVLNLDPATIQKFMTWLINRGYNKDNESPRFIYKGSV